MSLAADPIVLLHGSGTGASSWRAVQRGLEQHGATTFAPDMLGYGDAPRPSRRYGLAEELEHLRASLDAQGLGRIQLVAHSLGAVYGLHLRLLLGSRVSRLTLIEPVVVSVLREPIHRAAYLDLVELHQRFMASLADPAAAARVFVEHWSGAGSWDSLRRRERALLAALTPKLRLEMIASKTDPSTLAELARAAPPTQILLGEHTREGPRVTGQVLAAAFGTAPLVIAGAGHLLPLSHPEAVVNALRSQEELQRRVP